VKLFLAGASGVLGRRLVPLLVEAGHEVVGLTRSESKRSLLEDLGAEPLVGDVFEREWLMDAVAISAPDLVLSQLTDLPDDLDQIGEYTSANARIRREGVANLLEAARRSGVVEQFFAQSVAWELPGDGGRAVMEMESRVLDAGGTVLRYGQFYGPDTFHPAIPPRPPRIHVDEAARRTVSALANRGGVHELIEDDDSVP
jgi:nucleoside-diphosphate-sugar epimerase